MRASVLVPLIAAALAAHAGAQPVTINFDDVERRCTFAESTALRDDYLSLGVSFRGETGERDGGAVLDDCSNFNVTGYSLPNFFAFNATARMSDGGLPRTPALMVFPIPVRSVSFLVGSGWNPGRLRATALGGSGEPLSAVEVDYAGPMSPVVIAESGVFAIRLEATSGVFVVDDLSFDVDVCGAGTVDLGRSPIPSDVLFVNDSAGGARRTVSLLRHEPISAFVTSPPAATSVAPYVLYALMGERVPGEAHELPGRVGPTCFPTPITGVPEGLRVVVVANNVPHPRAVEVLGAPRLATMPAPSLVFRASTAARAPAAFVLQGVISDEGAKAGRWSVTNAVTVFVR